jgi:hypothetical protein
MKIKLVVRAFCPLRVYLITAENALAFPDQVKYNPTLTEVRREVCGRLILPQNYALKGQAAPF